MVVFGGGGGGRYRGHHHRFSPLVGWGGKVFK